MTIITMVKVGYTHKTEQYTYTKNDGRNRSKTDGRVRPCPCPVKKRPRFFLHNFNKCKHNIVIFGMSHPEESLCEENRKGIPNVIISLRSDDVILTSLETTLSRTASRKDTTIFCLISNNFRK